MSGTVTSRTRREWLRVMAAMGAGALVDGLFPRELARAATGRSAQQQDRAAAFRAQIGAIPIQSQPLAENITLLAGPGDGETKIVPGHGPLGTKADVVKYRDMLSTAAERVRKLKASGKSVEECAAAKPFADLDADWGKGSFNGDAFVKVVYLTL